MNHPEHGEIIETTLNTRVHDDVEAWKCTRCNSIVRKGEEEKFYEIDCDHYKELKEEISDNL